LTRPARVFSSQRIPDIDAVTNDFTMSARQRDGGVACRRDMERIKAFRRASISFGGLLRPFDAFLLDQRIKTLELRIARHTDSALQVARWLEAHPKVARVRYGGLESWARRQHQGKPG